MSCQQLFQDINMGVVHEFQGQGNYTCQFRGIVNNYEAVAFIELLHHRFREHVVVINVPGTLDVTLLKLCFITKIDKCGPLQLSGSPFTDDPFGKIALAKVLEGVQKFLLSFRITMGT